MRNAMISEKEEYSSTIKHHLEENRKSFYILFELKHYGNCIAIMCQELDQIIKILFLLKCEKNDKTNFIRLTVNNQKWYKTDRNEKKVFITDDFLRKYAESFTGWEKSIYNFGFSFKSLSNNLNYFLKNPIISLDESERLKIYEYIREYHEEDFPIDFSIDDLIPVLPLVFNRISEELKVDVNKI
jgi:hypothetical protein